MSDAKTPNIDELTTLTTDDDTGTVNDDRTGMNEQIATPEQGATPMHRQNFDEARSDEVLVEDNLADPDCPDIVDIADNEAVEHSNDDDL